MEFKGTKGKWYWSFGASNEMASLMSETGIEVCNFGDCTTYYPTEGVEPNDADALLISKAPEMFEMLKKIVIILNDKCTEGCVEKTWEDFQNGNGEDVGLDIDEFIKEAKKLIKEATEL
jgi:hypothetical protein